MIEGDRHYLTWDLKQPDLLNQSQSSRVNAFPQTPTDAKPVGSSFCRLSPVKLPNKDPHLNALFVVNWHEINGVFVL